MSGRTLGGALRDEFTVGGTVTIHQGGIALRGADLAARCSAPRAQSLSGGSPPASA